MMTLKLPLSVPVSRNKTFILNLNNYRNAHFQVLDKAKKLYVDEVRAALPSPVEKFTGQVELTYTLFQPTNRRVDISNPLSVIDKFTCDALTSLGVIPDDSAKYIPVVIKVWGGVDKENPRAELEIREIGRTIL